jgi:hypothetical protein
VYTVLQRDIISIIDAAHFFISCEYISMKLWYYDSLRILCLHFIFQLFIMWNVGLYTSPILATVLYRRGYFVFDGIVTIAKFLTGIGLILAASYCLRGIGRANNHTYISFLNSLTATKKELNKDTKVCTKFLIIYCRV